MGKIIHIDEDLLKEIINDAIEVYQELNSDKVNVGGAVIEYIRKIEQEEDNRPGSFYN